MQTSINNKFRHNPDIDEAEKILRSCVHCGFCTATCPTYQILGDELDSPRGRIYLIKQVLEGNKVTEKTQSHLDRCLTCRSCETTCPSGVQYARLVDIGREIVEQQVGRGLTTRIQRLMLRKILPYPSRFSLLLKSGQALKPLLPDTLKTKIPETQPITTSVATSSHKRKMLVLQGCVQSVTTPETNQAAARVLNKLGIELISAAGAGCCGAVSHHLSAKQEAIDFMRRNIDAWWPLIENNNKAEAIVITASGCGATVKEYGHILQHDPKYAQKAKHISDMAKDISEIIAEEKLNINNLNSRPKKVSFHSPCTLQHGQKLPGLVEKILEDAGFKLTHVNDAHICCGSAGTYSILQPVLSQKLLNNKLSALENEQPDVIATANVGCQMHLSSKTDIPVKHWIQLIDEVL